jgi:hypothetical protein
MKAQKQQRDQHPSSQSLEVASWVVMLHLALYPSPDPVNIIWADSGCLKYNNAAHCTFCGREANDVPVFWRNNYIYDVMMGPGLTILILSTNVLT